MAKDNETETVITPVARLAFPHLFEKDMREISGKVVDKYTATLLFPKDTDLSALMALAKKALVEKWPDPDKRPAGLKTPFRDGNVDGRGSDGEIWNGFENTVFIRISSKFRPGIVDQKVNPIIDPERIYSGCYVLAQVHAYAYDNMGNRGVSFGLNNIQFVKDGERLGGGGIPPKKAFSAIEGDDGQADDTDPADDPLAL